MGNRRRETAGGIDALFMLLASGADLRQAGCFLQMKASAVQNEKTLDDQDARSATRQPESDPDHGQPLPARRGGDLRPRRSHAPPLRSARREANLPLPAVVRGRFPLIENCSRSWTAPETGNRVPHGARGIGESGTFPRAGAAQQRGGRWLALRVWDVSPPAREIRFLTSHHTGNRQVMGSK